MYDLQPGQQRPGAISNQSRSGRQETSSKSADPSGLLTPRACAGFAYSMNLMPFAHLALLLMCLAVPACNRKPPLPADVEYMIRSKDLGLVGASVLAQGQRGVFRHNGGLGLPQSAIAKVTVPRSGPLLGAELVAELQTPCGVKLIPLKGNVSPAQETDQRKSPFTGVDITVTPESAPPPAVDVWTDAKEQKIGLGKAIFTGPKPDYVPKEGYLSLFDVSCQASFPVTVAGAEVGKVEAAQLREKSLFITAKKDVCYRYAEVVYGDGHAGSGTLLKGSQVHILPKDKIDYFLREAPSTGRAKVQGRNWELLEAPCQ